MAGRSGDAREVWERHRDSTGRNVIPRTLFVKIDLSLDLASEHLTDEEKTC